MLRKLVFMLVVAALGGVFGAAAGEHPWDSKRIYYVMEQNGRLREKGFFVRYPGSYQKTPCVVFDEEKLQYSDLNDQTPERSGRIKTLTTPGGSAIQRSEEIVLGEPGMETITIENAEARFDSTGYFGRPTRFPVPDGALFEVTGEWLAANAPRQGKTYDVDVIDRLGKGVVSERVEILERVADGTPAVWLAQFTSPGRPPMFARFTEDGRLLRLESSGLVYQVVNRDDYERGRIPRRGGQPAPVGQPSTATGSILNDGDYYIEFPDDPGYGQPGSPVVPAGGTASIPIGEAIPAWDNFAWIIMFADPPHEWHSIIQNTEYSQVEYAGVSSAITAVRNAPRVDAQAVFPMAVPPDVQPYMIDSPAVPSSSRAIIDAAYMAVADIDTKREETNILRAVSYLAGWIHQSVEVREWTDYKSSALDALTARSGDSLAHARLFAAMARTLGVPTRICQGFLMYTGRAMHHCWAEAWVNGQWVPVDTTVSRVGLPAGYVLAERSGGDGELYFDFASFMRNPELRLSLASAGRETPQGHLAELLVSDRRSYAYAEDDWLANLYWGFALRLPLSWIGSARLNSVEMTSPNRQASVKCEALAGNYGAGKEELDANVASLRENLSKFKLVDSRVVSFDSEGATPALFMDFTCSEGDMNLRCRQYVIPRRQRAFRISFWAAANEFSNYTADFDGILATLEF